MGRERRSNKKNESNSNRKPHGQSNGKSDKVYKNKWGRKIKPPQPVKIKVADPEDGIRLNKFLANAGICSRRDADKLIESGAVTINNKAVTQLGSKVLPDDIVHYGGEKVRREKIVYILINKPKDFITTVDDPQGRPTVLNLIGKACKERVYPVGRLDRKTTGVLLLTNDGALTKKLTHPSHGVKKIYHVELDKKVTGQTIKNLMDGVRLEDGVVSADKASFVGDGKNKREIGIELHSGKNRVIRRMLESLGYKVIKLDRVYFGGLTKKELPRGKYRFLTSQEVGMLHML